MGLVGPHGLQFRTLFRMVLQFLAVKVANLWFHSFSLVYRFFARFYSRGQTIAQHDIFLGKIPSFFTFSSRFEALVVKMIMRRLSTS